MTKLTSPDEQEPCEDPWRSWAMTARYVVIRTVPRVISALWWWWDQSHHSSW